VVIPRTQETWYMETLKELFEFMWKRKLLWLAPIVLALLLLGLMFFLGSSAGVVSPFVYAL